MSGNVINPKWIHQDESKCNKNTRRSIRYYRQLVLATPLWTKHELIAKIYNASRKHNAAVVDHIVPLNHQYVCGLHWEGNLQLITRSENAAKSNYWWPDMWNEQIDLIALSEVSFAWQLKLPL